MTSTTNGPNMITAVDGEFAKHSRAFLGKISGWESSTGDSIQDIASGLAVWFREYPRPMDLLASLNTHHPDSFAHSVNVCLLTAMLARETGLEDDDVRDTSLAGLLHDVGKLAVPVEILDKEAPLTRQEAARISVHSVAGARSLAAMAGLPGLVVVGTWEHHLHHDGKGGYPRPSRNTIPHPVSQMIALADFFDSLTTPKPYRAAQPRDRVLDMMREREGRVFRPLLLRSFLGIIDSID
jgi:HD-GYP domain-containing protein (c-di-GMP phosphodiesterase class II)